MLGGVSAIAPKECRLQEAEPGVRILKAHFRLSAGKCTAHGVGKRAT